MITDAQLTLSTAQAVTASAVSANVIDLGAARDIGAGEQLFLHILCTTAAAAAGAATVNFQVVTDSAEAITSPSTLVETGAIPIATLTAGHAIKIPLPRGAYERFLALNYAVGTGPLTAGAFTALIVAGTYDTATYPAGYAV